MTSNDRRISLADGRRVIFETTAGIAEVVKGKPGRTEDAVVPPISLHLRSLTSLSSPNPTTLLISTVAGITYQIATGGGGVDGLVAYVIDGLERDFPGMGGGSLEVEGVGKERLSAIHALHPDLAHRDPGPGMGIMRSYESMCVPPHPTTLRLLDHATNLPSDPLLTPSISLADHPDSALPLTLALAYNGWCRGLEVEGPTRGDVAEAVVGWAGGGGVAEELRLTSTGLPPTYHYSLFSTLAENPDLAVRRIRIFGESLDERSLAAIVDWLSGSTRRGGVIDIDVEADVGKRAQARWNALRTIEIVNQGIVLDGVGAALVGAGGVLEVVRLKGNGWKKSGSEGSWTAFVTNSLHLQTLDLSRTGIPVNYLAAVLQGVAGRAERSGGGDNLELDLEANNMGGEHADYLNSSLPHLRLRLLRLSRNDFGSENHLLPLILALRSARSVLSIELAGCLPTQPPQDLRQVRVVAREMAGVVSEGRVSVAIGGNRLGPGEVGVLFAALSSSSVLRRLDFTGMDLSQDSTAVALGTLLRTTPVLCELVVDGTGLGFKGLRAFIRNKTLVYLPTPHDDIANLRSTIVKSGGPSATPVLRRLSAALSSIDSSLARNRSTSHTLLVSKSRVTEMGVRYAMAVARRADSLKMAGVPASSVDAVLEWAEQVWTVGMDAVAIGLAGERPDAHVQGVLSMWAGEVVELISDPPAGCTVHIPDENEFISAAKEVAPAGALLGSFLDVKDALTWMWGRIAYAIIDKLFADLQAKAPKHRPYPQVDASPVKLPPRPAADAASTHPQETDQVDNMQTDRQSPPLTTSRSAAHVDPPRHSAEVAVGNGKEGEEESSVKKKSGLKSLVGSMFGKKKGAKTESQSSRPSNDNLSVVSPDHQVNPVSPEPLPRRAPPEVPTRKSLTVNEATRASEQEEYEQDMTAVIPASPPPAFSERPAVPERPTVPERPPRDRALSGGSNSRASLDATAPLSRGEIGDAGRTSQDAGTHITEGSTSMSRTSSDLVPDGEGSPNRSRKMMPSVAMSALAGVMMKGALKKSSTDLTPSGAPLTGTLPAGDAGPITPTRPDRRSIASPQDRGSLTSATFSAEELGAATTSQSSGSRVLGAVPPEAGPSPAAMQAQRQSLVLPQESDTSEPQESVPAEESAAPTIAALKKKMPAGAINIFGFAPPKPGGGRPKPAPRVGSQEDPQESTEEQLSLQPQEEEDDEDPAERARREKAEQAREEMAQRAMRVSAENLRRVGGGGGFSAPITPKRENRDIVVPPGYTEKHEGRVPEAKSVSTEPASPAPRQPAVPAKPKVPPKPPPKAGVLAQESPEPLATPSRPSMEPLHAAEDHDSATSPTHDDEPLSPREEPPARPVGGPSSRRPPVLVGSGSVGSAFSSNDDRAVELSAIEWLNKHQTTVVVTHADFLSCLKDGIVLIHSLEAASGQAAGKYNKRAILQAHKFDNLQVAVNFMGRLGVQLGGLVQPMVRSFGDVQPDALLPFRPDIINEDRQKILPSVQPSMELPAVTFETPPRSRLHSSSRLAAPSSAGIRQIHRYCPYASKFSKPTFRASPLSQSVFTAVNNMHGGEATGVAAAVSVAAGSGEDKCANLHVGELSIASTHQHAVDENGVISPRTVSLPRRKASEIRCSCPGPRVARFSRRRRSSCKRECTPVRRLPRKLERRPDFRTPLPPPLPADVIRMVNGEREKAKEMQDSRELREANSKRTVGSGVNIGNVVETAVLPYRDVDKSAHSLLSLQRHRLTLGSIGRRPKGLIPRIYRVPTWWGVTREQALEFEGREGELDMDYWGEYYFAGSGFGEHHCEVEESEQGKDDEYDCEEHEMYEEGAERCHNELDEYHSEGQASFERTQEEGRECENDDLQWTDLHLDSTFALPLASPIESNEFIPQKTMVNRWSAPTLSDEPLGQVFAVPLVAPVADDCEMRECLSTNYLCDQFLAIDLAGSQDLTILLGDVMGQKDAFTLPTPTSQIDTRGGFEELNSLLREIGVNDPYLPDGLLAPHAILAVLVHFSMQSHSSNADTSLAV
ncbi:hypothetical protein HDU93_000161 [Gonapodya sp. JEL0774]|nr:hypothetical protein HDU93_000161 [Gonapodya sp. JEL0774]